MFFIVNRKRRRKRRRLSYQQVFECANTNNVHFIFFPANATHLFQPLDVGVFAPLKTKWRQVVADFLTRSKRGSIPKESFPDLVATLWKEYPTININMKSSFRGCGIWPLNRNEILKRLPENKKKIVNLDYNDFAASAVKTLVTKLEEEKTGSTSKARKRGQKIPAGVAVAMNNFNMDSDCAICFKEEPSAVDQAIDDAAGFEEEEDRIKWISCDDCLLWFHRCCLIKAQATNIPWLFLDNFSCRDCKNKQN